MDWSASWGAWKKYGSATRRHVHELLAWGYADARANFRATHDETDITGLIAEAMKHRLDTTAPRPFKRYFVADDTPQAGGGRTGIRRRRADILVERSGTQPRLRYVLESKRLRRGSHPLSQYLGTEGLQRFVSGNYAPHALEAAMIGYVQTPTVEDWADELKLAFSGSERARMGTKEGLNSVDVVPALRDSWVSKHTREIGEDIVLIHVLLDCYVPADP